MLKNNKFLLAVALIFGMIAITLWTLRFFYDVEMIFPLFCNIIQFVAIAFLWDKTKII